MHQTTPAARRRPEIGLVAAVVAALLVVGVFAAGASAQRSKTPDGRALVEGLLLGTGEVAEGLPEVFGELPELPDEAAKAQHLLLDALDERDPRVFAALEKAVASGDHVAVQRSLDASSKALAAVVADGRLFEEIGGIALPYHYRWHPYRWHFRWQPFRWTHLWDQPFTYDYDYNYDFDYDYRWVSPFVGPRPWTYQLDPESTLANERFVDLVVERFAV